jgi:hypothetical protein
MTKVFTPAQRKKLIGEVSEQVTTQIRYELTELEYCGYDGGWFKPIQEMILESVAESVAPKIKQAIASYEGTIEREENTKLKKLEAENRELKKDLKKYAAIQKVIDDASQEVS